MPLWTGQQDSKGVEIKKEAIARNHEAAELNLSEEELKALIDLYDRDGDGRLSKKELKLAFKEAGLRYSGWRAEKAHRHADANRDGYISADEMSKLVDYARKWGFRRS